MKWRRIRIADDVSNEVLKAVKKAAAEHPLGDLPQLTFTESTPEWVLLYEHAQIGQITSRTMRYMKRKDLYYLAGLTFPHPALVQPMNEKDKK